MKVLILAYASEPGAGSEYGVGWQVPMVMSQRHPEIDVFVLTRSRCREKIEQSLAILNLSNLHYLFYDVPSWMYYKKEIGSKWGEQLNYLNWQLMCRHFIKRLNKQEHFDLIHHLTFNQYRTPSPGFFLNIPFVMGPVGGGERIHPSFFEDLTRATIIKEQIRKNNWDLHLFRIWCKWKKNRKCFLFSTKETQMQLKDYCSHYPSVLLPAIAYNPLDFANVQIRSKKGGSPFTLIYAGKALDIKGHYILLKSIKKAYIDHGIKDFVVKFVGIRFEEEQQRISSWIQELGMKENVEVIPFMQRDEMLDIMIECDLSVYTCFRDAGSMSVLESSVLKCPTICFDAGGQDAFPDDVLIKVPVGPTYSDTLNCLADKLLWAYKHRGDLAEIGARSRKYVIDNLTWEKKVDKIIEIYNQILVK